MRISVIGTGTMGGPIARNLARAGHEVTAWNRTREKAQSLTGDGVRVVDSPADAVEGTEVLVTMLSDADAVMTAMDGVRPPKGASWIQLSTFGLEGTERCAELASKLNVEFVDAPVLGTKEPAEKGELIVLASGPETARQRSEELFQAIGKQTLWLGEAGAGTRLKLVANSWIVSLVEGLAETFLLARGLDVDPASFLAAIENGPLDAPYVQLKGSAILAEDWKPRLRSGLRARMQRLCSTLLRATSSTCRCSRRSLIASQRASNLATAKRI